MTPTGKRRHPPESTNGSPRATSGPAGGPGSGGARAVWLEDDAEERRTSSREADGRRAQGGHRLVPQGTRGTQAAASRTSSPPPPAPRRAAAPAHPPPPKTMVGHRHVCVPIPCPATPPPLCVCVCPSPASPSSVRLPRRRRCACPAAVGALAPPPSVRLPRRRRCACRSRLHHAASPPHTHAHSHPSGSLPARKPAGRCASRRHGATAARAARRPGRRGP